MTAITETTAKNPASPYSGHPLWGALLDLRTDPLHTLERIAQRGAIAPFRMGPVRGWLVSSPELIEEVLVKRARIYGKGTRPFAEIKRLLGEGLLTAEGEAWRKERRVTQPAFHHSQIEAMASVITEGATEVLRSWKPLIEARQRVDIHREMSGLTVKLIARLLFADELEEAELVREALSELLIQFPDRTMSPLALPHWIPTPKNRRFRGALGTLDGIVARVVERRRRRGGEAKDLLGMLLAEAEAAPDRAVAERTIRDEVLTFLLAGHETTANALTWTLYLLSLHPEVSYALGREIEGALAGQAPGLGDLARLELLDRVVKESLRLFPPAWVVDRSPTVPDRLGAFEIAPGEIVLVSPWVTQRDGALWPDPNRFDPDRFLSDSLAARPKLAYFPFGAGNRKCIGEALAWMETKLILATLLQQVTFRLDHDHPVLPEAGITLRPRGGLYMWPAPVVGACSLDELPAGGEPGHPSWGRSS